KSDTFTTPLGTDQRLQTLLEEGEVIFARRKPAGPLVKNMLPGIRVHDAKKTNTNAKYNGRRGFLRTKFSQAPQQFPVTRQSQAVDAASLSAFSRFFTPPHPA